MALFGEFGFIPEPLLKMETQTRNLLPRVAFQRSIFGEGVLVSRSNEGLALISVVDGDNSVVQDVVTSVFNGSYFLDLHFEQHDKDLFYFVKVFLRAIFLQYHISNSLPAAYTGGLWLLFV